MRSVRWMGASNDHLFTLGHQQAFVMDTFGRCLHKVDIDWQSMNETTAVIYKDSMLFDIKRMAAIGCFAFFQTALWRLCTALQDTSLCARQEIL